MTIIQTRPQTDQVPAADAVASTRTPVTFREALFTYYDIESLSNVFTLSAYTPRPEGRVDVLEVFHLVDDNVDGGNLTDQINPDELRAHVFKVNPALPRDTAVVFYDLRTDAGIVRLAELMGLSDAQNVGNPRSPSSYPARLRPVCDTDPDYDVRVHSYLAGYNSQNYDTTMVAILLANAFADYVETAQDAATMAGHLATRSAAFRPQFRKDAQKQLADIQRSGKRLRRVTAKSLRAHNDKLFSDSYISQMYSYLDWGEPAGKIRRNFFMSGRHLDVSRLNELQSKVALKRLLGLLGRQIKESEKLGHDSVITSGEEFMELIGYNVSDCLGLSQLALHEIYSSAFDLKAGLLAQYHDSIVLDKAGQIRRKRLTIDASSAKFVGQILSPDGNLQDIEAVSFLYPHADIAAERGIPQVNVLDECVAFFENTVVPNRDRIPAEMAAYRQFMEVVAYYRAIEGKNFNESREYQETFARPLPVHRLGDITAPHTHDDIAAGRVVKAPINLPYFAAGGVPTSCFATFSTGGIHGAEIDEVTFGAAAAEYGARQRMLSIAKALFPDPAAFIAEAKRQHNLLRLPDGTTVDKDLVINGVNPEGRNFGYRKAKPGDPEQAEQIARAMAQVPDPADLIATRRSDAEKLNVAITDHSSPNGVYVIEGKVVLKNATLAKASYRDELGMKEPQRFVVNVNDGSNKLPREYAHTSAGYVMHEDFTSYYPNLLRMMRAFYNPELGEDRYASIFFDKERYGKMMKQPGLSEEEKSRLSILRNGTKLILNSASGAGDASHDTPIRMNNQIISMRIIGQLFSWRIGQAQTLAGAKIISTNTDGLYSLLDPERGFTEEVNNRVLEEQSEAIGVEIEPEPMFLISKDSNNRLELLPEDDEYNALPEGAPVTDWRIATAGGGTLACFKGPRMDKALAHPAVIDHALAKYLRTVAARGEQALSEAFDDELGARLIAEALDMSNLPKTATMFQNVLAASRGSLSYPFAADPLDEHTPPIQNPHPLQTINRVFVVRAGTAGAVSLQRAVCRKISPASQQSRQENGLPTINTDPVAMEILAHHGFARNQREVANTRRTLLPIDHDVVVQKINGIEQEWSMLICNDDLYAMDQSRLAQILESLDLEAYVDMLRGTFMKSWKNAA